MAPEIILNEGYSEKVDTWGLGCVIYEMIKGQNAFKGSNINILFKKILYEEPEFGKEFSEDA